MEFEHLKVREEDEGRVVLVEFDHGKANEMGTPQLEELERLAAELREGPAMTLITFSRRVSGRGTPIFVAGANVTERVGWDAHRVKEHVRWQRRVLHQLRSSPVFHVAIVGGVALGWGTEYLLTADYRIATPGAVFALPETGLGILPGAGGTAELWAQIGLAQTLRLGITGERIGPAEAVRIGLCQEESPSLDAALARARALAALVSRKSPTAVAAFKRGVLAAVGKGQEERAEIEARAYRLCVDSGEAARGREQFDAIRRGHPVVWGPRTEEGDHADS